MSQVTLRPASAARSCIADVAMLAKEIPLFPVDRWIDLRSVAAARSQATPRIGWAAIFLKAYGRVVRRTPALRSWYLPGIRPRLATTSDVVATCAVNRREPDGDRLCFARLPQPGDRSLPDLQAFIDACTVRPLAEMFRRQLQLEMLPGPLRRLILRWNLRSCSPKRAARLGTFSLSTLAGLGAGNRLHPTLCSTSLSYGPLEADGRCLVTIIADHRVVDGFLIARSLAELEAELNDHVRRELTVLRTPHLPAEAPPQPVAAPAAAA